MSDMNHFEIFRIAGDADKAVGRPRGTTLRVGSVALAGKSVKEAAEELYWRVPGVYLIREAKRGAICVFSVSDEGKVNIRTGATAPDLFDLDAFDRD